VTQHEQRYITEKEDRVLNLVIEWRMTRTAMASALVELELKHEADLLIKERREKVEHELQSRTSGSGTN
jgi:hypothetical protein